MAQRTYSFGLFGGLDIVTPPEVVKPGKVLSAVNYEPADEGGYRRMIGYERFDGRLRPSEAAYWILDFDAGTGTEPSVGNIVTGLTSTASGRVHLVVTESGTWGVDAAGYLVLFEVSGDFQDNEALQVSAVTFATSANLDIRLGADTNALDEQYLRAAREDRRGNIVEVPGAGPVNGVWFYKGVVYAFRDNVGQTEGVMHQSTAAGWTTVNLGNYIDFSGGSAEFLEGETVTAAPSGATGVVVGVGVTSGSWSQSDAAGRLYIKTITGTFTASDTLTSTAGAANCDSTQTAVTLPPGGIYEFQNYNFAGSLATRYMWGCNGVGRGFRFDGTDFTFVHITGLSDANDKPTYLKAHKKQLFLAIGASVFHSAVGLPMVYDAVRDAGEIPTGDTVTGLQDQPGGILGIFNRNSTFLLYGDDVNNFDLVNYSLERGAINRSTQDLGTTFYCDDRGVHVLKQTDAYGDLKQDSISEHIDPFYQNIKSRIIDSIRIKAKNQYRIYNNNKTGVILRWDANSQNRYNMRYEFMPFEYLDQLTTICAEEDIDGFERIFWGSDNGFVYEEVGDSFDGQLMEYALRLVYCHCGTSRQKKRFHKITLQVDAPDVVPIQFYPEFSYGDVNQPDQGGEGEVPPEVKTGGGIWGSSFWGEFFWDTQFVGEMEAYLDGQGINASILMRGESNFERPHTLSSLTYNYTPRGLKR